MGDNELGHLIRFVQGLQDAHISYSLDSVRDAIMVTIPFPDRYIEAEFFADGRVEVQSFGPPASQVATCSPEDLLRVVVAGMESAEGPDPLDALFGK